MAFDYLTIKDKFEFSDALEECLTHVAQFTEYNPSLKLERHVTVSTCLRVVIIRHCWCSFEIPSGGK